MAYHLKDITGVPNDMADDEPNAEITESKRPKKRSARKQRAATSSATDSRDPTTYRETDTVESAAESPTPAAKNAAAGVRKRLPKSKKETQSVAEKKGKAATAAGATADEIEPPVTEKPVPTQMKISQFVVSVDDSTGAIVKIERLDEQTGLRTELTQQEYAAGYALASYAGYLTPYLASHAANLYPSLRDPAAEAYLKGVTDYIKAVTAKQ